MILGTGKVVVITGANNGIGLELAKKMLAEGSQVIALIRSSFSKDDLFIQSKITTGQLRIYKADLSDFNSLKNALEEIKATEKKIDFLFNNAGGSFPSLLFSKQNRELHYELQTVVPYIIFKELSPLFEMGEDKTIVNTSSAVILRVKQFDPDTLENPSSFKKLFGPYATAKLALSLWTKEIAKRESANGFRFLSVDPGSNNTLRKEKKSGIPFYIKPLMKFFFSPPTKGAALLYDAAMDKTGAVSGDFIVKGKSTKVTFAEYSSIVLEGVHRIYVREFLNSEE
ncbi:short-chain dehydrogenase [Niallia circulans]|uniref:Short-chain dehydrogenase n=1 Tax=Niallia circulans TaxID=1397 RepID=A0A0J1IBC8_NIACI|nr:short-chain dehydrogenase [Niallia circulans]MDR4318081.1 SDR family NAD(P)-dependent oxidoreductase [Niallia circulans]QKH63729.1 SDR family NAD(P)-dependent oxidoreductase [Niallia circulans]